MFEDNMFYKSPGCNKNKVQARLFAQHNYIVVDFSFYYNFYERNTSDLQDALKHLGGRLYFNSKKDKLNNNK